MKLQRYLCLSILSLGLLSAGAATASTVQFNPSSYAVAENEGFVRVRVTATRTGNPADVITVNYATANGSATSPADYAQSSGTLTFGAGEIEKTFDVPIIDDNSIEGAENFTVILSSPSNATLGNPSSATVTILDDDSMRSTFIFSPSSYTVDESAGTVRVTVVRSGGLGLVASVNYSTSEGSGRAGSDYTATSGTLTFPSSSVDPERAKAQTIDIPILNDFFLENSENFFVTLSQPSSNGMVGTPSSALVTINDDDSATTVRFSPTNYSVNEAAPARQVVLTVTAQRSGDPNTTVRVEYRTRPGTAIEDRDYSRSEGTVEFGPGQTQQQIAVGILDDNLIEPAETFFVDLSNPTNASLLPDGSSTANITIQDDDSGVSVVRFSASSYDVGESDGTAALTITRSGGLGYAVTVRYRTADGTAKSGADYAPQDEPTAFQPGESSKTVQIPIIDDAVTESIERFSVTLSTTDPNASIGSPSTAEVAIRDDDPPPAPVITSPSSASGTKGQPFSYQITATGNPTSYNATGLPSGLFVNRSNGLISGTPTVSGTFNVTLSATDSSGATGTSTLTLTISEQTDPSPTPTPSPTATPTPTASPSSSPADLQNISTRARAGNDDNVIIGGFILQGDTPKRVILRAIGPSLEDVGVAGSLADPTLELFNASGESIGFNDNWKTGGQRAEIEQTGVPPGNERESALVMNLQPSNYTAIVRGANGGTGVALVEAYDLDSAASRLVNISTRSNVSIGENVMIGGFIIGSEHSTKVMLRAIGPSLAQADPPVENALIDPSLELRDGQGSLIVSNDNWVNSPQRQQIQESGLAPADGRESAIIAALPKGNYTAIVRSSDGSAGIALVEVYRLTQ